MIVQCVDCERYDLKGSGMAKHGLGVCKLKPRWEHPAALFPRRCDQFLAAEATKAAARRDWFNNKNGVRHE